MGRRTIWLFGFLLGLAVCASPARAETYEWERTQKLLKRLDLTLEEQPDHKRIAWVKVVRDDVFVPDEIWPLWFNWFHGRTKEHIVRRELLFAEGSSYEP